MASEKLSLGIDTSNYKTSVAITSENGQIIFNEQNFLNVNRGERGLRQSDALFQHVNRLPDVIAKALTNDSIRKRIGCIAVSNKPRPIEGSYMPVFNAGIAAAKTLSAALNIPLYYFSHQEGHIEAIRYYSNMKNINPIICFHFSGGTTEAVLVNEKEKIFKIVGGSKDISYGQVIDRVGVSLGIDFPCGNFMDSLASCNQNADILTPIKVSDGYFNLSGIETQCQRILTEHSDKEIACCLFFRISQSIEKMTLQLSKKYNINNFIFAGGVSCSTYIRNYIGEHLKDKINYTFGKPELSADNAVGISLLGGKNIWL